jgi:hypothetical protein
VWRPGNGKGQIFVKGEVIKTVPEAKIVETLIEEAIADRRGDNAAPTAPMCRGRFAGRHRKLTRSAPPFAEDCRGLLMSAPTLARPVGGRRISVVRDALGRVAGAGSWIRLQAAWWPPELPITDWTPAASAANCGRGGALRSPCVTPAPI